MSDLAKQLYERSKYDDQMIVGSEVRAVLREQHQEIERLTKDNKRLTNDIDNATMSASETHKSWKHRCYAIMGALGFDYGDPDWEMPDDRKRNDALEADNKCLRSALEKIAGGYTANWKAGMTHGSTRRLSLIASEALQEKQEA